MAPSRGLSKTPASVSKPSADARRKNAVPPRRHVDSFEPARGARSGDYARVRFRGVVMNSRTRNMLLRAETFARNLGVRVPLRLAQGSYHRGVRASGHTHDGGGALDVSVRGMSRRTVLLTVKAMRMAGFAAWSRGFTDRLSRHIHAMAIGDRQMTPQARRQVAEYFAGGDGLAGRRPDGDRSIGRPVPLTQL